MTETEAPAELLEAMHKTYYRDLDFAVPEAMARVHDVVVAYYKAAAQAKLAELGEAYDAAPGVAEAAPPVTLTYTNWRGETAERTILPQRLWFGATEWHPEPQWLLTAIDVEKGAERDFALKDFGWPRYLDEGGEGPAWDYSKMVRVGTMPDGDEIIAGAVVRGLDLVDKDGTVIGVAPYKWYPKPEAERVEQERINSKHLRSNPGEPQ